MFRQIILLAAALVVVGSAGAGVAHADDRASGALMHSAGGSVGEFEFDPVGEKVRLYDAQPDGWGMLVELWWDGKLRRWCYNTKGAGTTQKCNFKIPEGKRITFYLAEISWAWFKCKRQGCGKRKHMWAGPNRWGCQVAPKRWPCGYPGPINTAPETNDFRGVS